MPRRDDLHKILIIGSGPIVIGQAGEFDYSGTQACKVLLEEGYEVVLVNSNPATIMTDPEFATRTYIEPLDLATLTRIIELERPDALLPTLGGQTALNLAKALKDAGMLDLWEVELIGADYDAIHRAEDRHEFRTAMEEVGLRVPRSAIVHADRRGRAAAADELGLPLIVRPAFTLGGSGGGIAHDRDGLRADRRRRPRAEPDHPGAGRGVGARLGRVRARGDARPQRQRRRHLLDREHRPDGRAHRRQRHGRAGADAHRPAVPGAARRRQGDHPRGRRRDRRLQRPVRGPPRDAARSSSSR